MQLNFIVSTMYKGSLTQCYVINNRWLHLNNNHYLASDFDRRVNK